VPHDHRQLNAQKQAFVNYDGSGHGFAVRSARPVLLTSGAADAAVLPVGVRPVDVFWAVGTRVEELLELVIAGLPNPAPPA
jgi:hypothetical protein